MKTKPHLYLINGFWRVCWRDDLGRRWPLESGPTLPHTTIATMKAATFASRVNAKGTRWSPSV